MTELVEVDETTYHADRNSLSSTGARKLLECPARFRHEQLFPPAAKGVFDFGKLAHKLVLGEGAEIVEIGAADYRTQTAKTLRDEARAEGKIPALTAELTAAKDMAVSVHQHPVAASLFRDGEAEKSGYWTDPSGVRLRFRPDWLTDGICVDLKTTASADPAAFIKSVVNYGYHLQAAWYITGLAALGIEARFLFVAVEKTAPYPVSVIELDAEALNEGARRMRKAVDLYAKCLETDIWPAYGEHIHTLSLPYWALRERDQAIYEEAAELERNWNVLFTEN